MGQWNDLIPILVENVVNAQSTELKKEATLEAIGKQWTRKAMSVIGSVLSGLHVLEWQTFICFIFWQMQIFFSMFILTWQQINFRTAGYICQDIDAEVLTEQSNPILTAIIHGMRSTETSNHVRLAATQALLNSLEFTKANFDKENERNFIMEVVCEATQSNDMRISVAALQCLVSIHTFKICYLCKR